ncbi:MAG: hypothetical protein COA43_07070 [Robiginitomaculum sp.]|nr:MAG: hypothetical protein COA43_07070 [Robiginitomaculum sp.]
MESKANYAMIGTFVLVAIFSVIAFIAYISGRGLSEKLTDYVVVYDTPPRGISVGSEVRYNGLKMGEVTLTRLDPTNQNNVLVSIRVLETTPVMKDTYGQLEPLGLTGLSYIQLRPGSSVEAIAPQVIFGEVPRITGKESQFDYFLGGGESIIDNANVALSSIVSALNPQAQDDFHNILRNIEIITGNLAQSDLSKERIDAVIIAVERAALDVSVAAVSVDVTAKDVSTFLNSGEIKQVLLHADQVMKTADIVLLEYKTLAEHGTVMADEGARMIEQFTATGLQDLSASMMDLRSLMEGLNRVVSELERSPLEFVVGQKKEVTELPQ